jgi:uncharacterized DUF497 family protein
MSVEFQSPLYWGTEQIPPALSNLQSCGAILFAFNLRSWYNGHKTAQKDSTVDIRGLIWPDGVEEKIKRLHEVTVWEVEEVFLNAPEFRRGPKGKRRGEDIYYALGQTDAGRYLFVVFIYKRNRKALILTAREMTDREKGGHRRRRHG